jgi:hypothetical protein
VSKDAIIAAVVLGNDEIHVYRVNFSSFYLISLAL